jgi:hypothetical protein
MQGTLVLTVLAVRSSYLQELEKPLGSDTEAPDTVQWWIASTGSWRIKTYAIDHDIHTFSVGGASNLTELALANAQKHYGDVIQSNHVIELRDCRDPAEVSAAFRAEGLEPRIEIAEGPFAFWKPDDGRYHSQSQPK